MREKNTTTRRRNAKRAQNAVAMLLLIASLLSMGGFAFDAELEPQPPAQEGVASPSASGLSTDPEQPVTSPETTEQDPEVNKAPAAPEETVDPEETADPVPSPADPEETEAPADPESSADPNACIMAATLGSDDPEGEPAMLGLDNISVRYFVAENGDWKEITPENSVADGSMDFAGKNRYYVTVDTVYNVYSDYGFKTSDITSADDRIFPHTKVEDKNKMHTDAAPAKNTKGVWCIPLGSGSLEFHLYYVPTNKSANTTVYFTGAKNVSNEQLKKDNSFYTVEVNTSGLSPEDANLASVSASPVFTGSTVTVTLPKLSEDAHWRLTDGERSLAMPETGTDNGDNTVTYTINNISSRYVFSVSHGLTVEYDAALRDNPLPVGNNIVEDGKINGKSTYSIDIADG